MHPKLKFFFSLFLCSILAGRGATHYISSNLEPGESLAQYDLGARDLGPPDRSVRLVELATLPGEGQVQQIVGRSDGLYIVLKEGRLWRWDLSAGFDSLPFLDVDAARPAFLDAGGWQPARGLRGFAFHPSFEINGLVYTLHKEAPDGSDPDYGTDFLHSEFVLAEWNMLDASTGHPGFRALFRIRFEHDYHAAQQLGFNPMAAPGEDDFEMLYACFGDNGNSTGGSDVLGTSQLRMISDISNVGQNFASIQAGVIRIHPEDPSGMSDAELARRGLKRSPNGRFSIPLTNPFVGQSGVKEELFAKGFRNPLTLSFSPKGKPIIADVGEQSFEEINVLVPGGNHGWPNREGTFLVAWADQVDGSPLGADASMRRIPRGDGDDPARAFFVRDKDQTNLRVETLARSGPLADRFQYPVFQFSHEGNASDTTDKGLAAVVGGDVYDGFWAEELEGLYLFGNISTDQIFYGQAARLDDGSDHAGIFELPLVDALGQEIRLSDVVGNSRANMRFGRDSFGNLYLASKTNQKLYRFEGTPELDLQSDGMRDGRFHFSLIQPPAEPGSFGSLHVSEDLAVGFHPADEADYEIVGQVASPDGRLRVLYRYTGPIDPVKPKFFRFE